MLKPCPLCGRKPKETQRKAAPDMPHRFVAFRACHGGGYLAHVHVYGTGNTPNEAALDADAKWNTRHDQDEAGELRAALAAIVDLGGAMGSALYAETVDHVARRALGKSR